MALPDGGAPRHAHPPQDGFTRGRGLFTAIEYIAAGRRRMRNTPCILTTGRILYQYHTATMSRRSSGLVSRTPEAFVEINPADAKKLNLGQGERLTISSRRGSIQASADISGKCAEGVVFIPFHYSEAAVNRLTNACLTPWPRSPSTRSAP